jgi:hypothetical protein
VKTLSLFSLLIAVLLFTGAGLTQAAPKDRIDKGTKVAARWTDGWYYVGTVTGEGEKKFHVLFEDGDTHWVLPEHIFTLRADRKFEVGDRVLAAWKTAQMFPGVVTAVNPSNCRVKWDDGDTPSDVLKDRMVHKGKK